MGPHPCYKTGRAAQGKKVTHALQTGLTARTALFPLLPQDQRKTSVLSKATLPSQSNLMKKCKLYKGEARLGFSPLTSETSLNINLKPLPTRPAPSILPEHSPPSPASAHGQSPTLHSMAPHPTSLISAAGKTPFVSKLMVLTALSMHLRLKVINYHVLW